MTQTFCSALLLSLQSGQSSRRCHACAYELPSLKLSSWVNCSRPRFDVLARFARMLALSMALSR
jgi:hypothetical protein